MVQTILHASRQQPRASCLVWPRKRKPSQKLRLAELNRHLEIWMRSLVDSFPLVAIRVGFGGGSPIGSHCLYSDFATSSLKHWGDTLKRMPIAILYFRALWFSWGVNGLWGLPYLLKFCAKRSLDRIRFWPSVNYQKMPNLSLQETLAALKFILYIYIL